ncbi:bifunctional DNA primase/polymerase [Microbacterium enclense]|uniref:bifunctional DNA primase/polymerase n=1 Tax=Microbacterium enclense TaxID=993073 RepID=UPI00341CC68E
MPRLDGSAPASERLFSPRHCISRHEAETAVSEARRLAGRGAAVFLARPATGRTGDWSPSGGHGGSGYWIPRSWELTRPGDTTALEQWRYGDALALVTGHEFDVIDIDPRNGGDRDLAELRSLGLVPPSYARADTPSGGTHLYVAAHGVHKTKRGGIDLQAGTNGEGHGFVWIAPTVRRSKADDQIRPYKWVETVEDALVAPPSDSARDFLAWFREGETPRGPAVERPYSGSVDGWLATHTSSLVSPAVQRALQPYLDGTTFAGHTRMLDLQKHLVMLAGEGHPGVPQALDFAQQVWLASAHTPGEDPAQEWTTGLEGAVSKYGGSNR